MRGRQGALNAKFDGNVFLVFFFLELHEAGQNILGDVVNGKWSPDFADHSQQIELL